MATWMATALGTLVSDAKDYLVTYAWSDDTLPLPENTASNNDPLPIQNRTNENGATRLISPRRVSPRCQETFSPKELLQSISICIQYDFTADDEVHYVVSVMNQISQAKVNIHKTDADFAKLREGVGESLEYGHICDGICPWFYFDIQARVPPTEYWFQSPHDHDVLESHVATHRALLQDLFRFILWPHRQNCIHATRKIPPMVLNFLLQGQSDPRLFRHRPPKATPVFSHAVFCTLCTDEKATHGISCLPCGHSFHDECILAALNHELACPTCRRSSSWTATTPPPISWHEVLVDSVY